MSLASIFTERFRRPQPGVVEQELIKIRDLQRGYPRDDYLTRLETYLSAALTWGLSGQAAISSCLDLAETQTTDPVILWERGEKTKRWNEACANAARREIF